MSVLSRQLRKFVCYQQGSVLLNPITLHQQSTLKRNWLPTHFSIINLSIRQLTSSEQQNCKLNMRPLGTQAPDEVKSEVKSASSKDTKTEISKDHKPTTYTAKLKQAVTQYGSTVMVFHITISLISLGICYTIIASGVDMSAMLEKIGLSENAMNKLASSSGTFAAAYLVHKVLMPVRVSITLACTPFIVRYLRKIGVIKKPIER